MKSREYMDAMYSALTDKLINKDSMYYGKDGHLRLAREIGYALNDFNEEEQKNILHSSYSVIYVRGCYLKPILDNKEWVNEMLRSKDKYKK